MQGTFTRGRVVGGKYRVGRWLAKGGMGSVWIAEHVELGLEVALKAVLASSDETTAKMRFKREARAAAGLKSPHVVRVFDYGIEGGVPYLVMELLEGEDLKDRLLRQRRIPLSAAAEIVGQIAEALHEAHEAGLIHRDVKPRNIFLARAGSQEVAKLLDFGVAKDVSTAGTGEETGTGLLLGSARYMSPEQARGERVDGRSDVLVPWHRGFRNARRGVRPSPAGAYPTSWRSSSGTSGPRSPALPPIFLASSTLC